MSKITSSNTLVVFQDKKIRRLWYQNEWYFSVVDIIDALDATSRPRKYWSDLKKKLKDEGFELSEKIGQLKMPSPDAKQRFTDCARTPIGSS
jgi:DNA-damage-inducible protein D